MGQTFSLTVPNTMSVMTFGSGPVDGISFTTDQNAFHHAKNNAIHESKSMDMRLVCSKVLGACAGTGVIIGTPCTIQVTAGGAVQVYAGAGLSPSIGSATGPGDAFGPSEPASFSAGERAALANRVNDVIGGLGSVAGGVMDFMSAGSNLEKAAAGFGALKGAWDAGKAALGVKKGESGFVDGADGTVGAYGDAGLGLAVGIATSDPVGIISSIAKAGGKALEGGVASNAGPPAGNPTPATGPSCTPGAAGGAMGAPGDGSARIHEVAPANIDRKCGRDMTAAVAGNKKTDVDGKIDYTSGASISFKAFNKISNQSLFFDATGLVAAKMTGYAKASVESFGKATLSGKYKVEVKTWGKGKVEAGALLEIKAKGKIGMEAGGVLNMKATGAATLHAADVGIVGKGQVSIKAPTVHLRGDTVIHKTLSVKQKVEVDNSIFARARIKSRAQIENPHFKAG